MWEDVFPDVEAGEGQDSAKNQAVLLTDSDDSGDESFKVTCTKKCFGIARSGVVHRYGLEENGGCCSLCVCVCVVITFSRLGINPVNPACGQLNRKN